MAALPRSFRARSGPAVCAVGAALLVSALVLLLGSGHPPTPEGPPAPVAAAGELRAEVGEATWLGMDHDMSTTASGYQMPPAMMPGMPATGEDRLSIALTLVNTGGRTLPIDPAGEFTLHAGPGQPDKPLYGTTFGELPRLGAGSAVAGTLMFDLPPADLAAAAWIAWDHDGSHTRLAVPEPASPHAHGK